MPGVSFDLQYAGIGDRLQDYDPETKKRKGLGGLKCWHYVSMMNDWGWKP